MVKAKERELWRYECSQCQTVKMYRDDIDELPEGWYRLEDRAVVNVLCSVRCLSMLVSALESSQSVDAVDSVNRGSDV